MIKNDLEAIVAERLQAPTRGVQSAAHAEQGRKTQSSSPQREKG